MEKQVQGPTNGDRKAPNTIGFFVFSDVEEQDFVGPWEMFGLWEMEAKGPTRFLFSETKKPIRCAHGLQILPDYSIDDCPEFDALVIPGGKGRKDVLANDAVCKFLKMRATTCQDILSVCTGSLILEALDLLNIKKATTHWEFISSLKQNSSISVQENVRYVRDGNICTAAGIFAGNDMALAYIYSFQDTEAPDQTQRRGDAGKVQLYAEYLPSPLRYDPEMDLSTAPDFIQRCFAKKRQE